MKVSPLIYNQCITVSKPLPRSAREAGRLLVLAAPVWRLLQHKSPLAVRNRLMISRVRVVMAHLSFVLGWNCCFPSLLFTLLLHLQRTVMSVLLIYFFNMNVANQSCMQQPCEVSPGLSHVQWTLHFICLFWKSLSCTMPCLPFHLLWLVWLWKLSGESWVRALGCHTTCIHRSSSTLGSAGRIPDDCKSLDNLSPCA